MTNGPAHEPTFAQRTIIRFARTPPRSSANAAALMPLLSAAELERHTRYSNPPAGWNFVCARALLRITLSEHYGGAPSQWELGITEHGKPFVLPATTQPAIAINLSHTEGAVAVALSEASDVGIDVEDKNRTAEVIKLAKRHFSDAEHRSVAALPEHEARHAFFRLWTMKEAYMKGRGLGFALSLSGIEGKEHAEHCYWIAPPAALEPGPRSSKMAASAIPEHDSASLETLEALCPWGVRLFDVDQQFVIAVAVPLPCLQPPEQRVSPPAEQLDHLCRLDLEKFELGII